MLVKTLILFSLLFGAQSAAAQTSRSPYPTPTPEPSFREIEENARQGQVHPGERRVKPPTKAELREIAAATAVDPEIKERYGGYLSKWRNEAGLIRIFPDFDCVVKSLVKVGGECAQHIAGHSYFGFLGKNGPYFHLNHGRLTTDAILTHVLFTDLGEVKLEEVSLSHPGVEALGAFVPAGDFASARGQFRAIRKGVTIRDFKVSDSVQPEYGRVYAVRTISFRGKIFDAPRSYGVDYENPIINSLLVQRWVDRKDATTVFSIVDVGEDGSVHILWRRLATRKAPMLQFTKPTPDPVFK